MSGVPVTQIKCPSCGERFVCHAGTNVPILYVERDDIGIEIQPRLQNVKRSRYLYLHCVNGHMWSIKTLYRVQNDEDEILLDKLIGFEP